MHDCGNNNCKDIRGPGSAVGVAKPIRLLRAFHFVDPCGVNIATSLIKYTRELAGWYCFFILNFELVLRICHLK